MSGPAFNFLSDSDITAGAHLLPALIPHTVLNRDVTVHLSSRGWIRTVVPTQHDVDRATVATREARTCVSLAPWNDGSDFGLARLAALIATVTTPIPRALVVLYVLSSLRDFLTDTEDYDIALENAETAIGSAGTPLADGTFFSRKTAEEIIPSLVRAAVAWLRAAPQRRPIDLPRFNAAAVLQQPVIFDDECGAAVLALLAPLVRRVVFRDARQDPLLVLTSLPAVTEVGFLHDDLYSQFVSAVQSAAAAGDASVTAIAQRLEKVTLGGRCRAPAPMCLLTGDGAPMFPSLTTVTSVSEGEPDLGSTWDAIARLPGLRHLDVSVEERWDKYTDSDDAEDPDHSDGVAHAVAGVSATLQTLCLTSTVAGGLDLTNAALHRAVCGCPMLRSLQLSGVEEAHVDFSRDMSSLSGLRRLVLNDLRFSAAGQEAAVHGFAMLPSALPHLEVLHMSSWQVTVPPELVAALARGKALVEWKAEGVSFDACDDDPSAGRCCFPALRVAHVPFRCVGSYVAAAPMLERLALTDDSHQASAVRDALHAVTFASPRVYCAVLDECLCRSLDPVATLKRSNVWGLRGSFVDYFDHDTLEFPATLRHLCITSHARLPVRVKYLQVLRAAAQTSPGGSLLESLTLDGSFDVDVLDVLTGENFPHLRALTIRQSQDPQTFESVLPQLRALCGDVVLHTGTAPLDGHPFS